MPTFTNENPEHTIGSLNRKELHLKNWRFKNGKGFDEKSEMTLWITFNVVQEIKGTNKTEIVPVNPPSSVFFNDGDENAVSKVFMFKEPIPVPPNCVSFTMRVESSTPFEIVSPTF
ncbi:MAG TPA: hypothetical protein VI757_05525 [Bacteroidia bacterium]|nr:hypothetical protein [Bacteroidia bacterium]